MEETKDLKMADCFITAMFLPKEYKYLYRLRTGKKVLYLLLLLLLIAVIRFAIPVLGAVAGLGGIKTIILDQVPAFSLENGVFSFDKKLELSDESLRSYTLIDTEVERFTRDDIPRNMNEVILVSSHNMLMYNAVAGGSGIVQEQDFSDLKELTFNNQEAAKKSGLVYLLMGIAFAVVYVVNGLQYFFLSLLFAAVVHLMSRGLLISKSFGTTYWTALFAQSIGSVVLAVCYCIGSNAFVMAGSVFHMMTTVIIMNLVLVRRGQRQ